jgi:putative oxidoreductase
MMMKLEQHNLTALVARLFMSSLFVLYGYFKLTGFAGTVAYMGRQGLPAPRYSLRSPSLLNLAVTC